MKSLCSVLGMIVLLAGLAQADVQKALDDRENVLASLLWGAWEPDAELAKLLALEASSVRFTFERDDAAVPDEVLQRLGKRMEERGRGALVVHAVGKVTLARGDREPRSCPFVLTTLHGNPHVVYFRERGGDPFGDTESFTLFGVRTHEDELSGPNDRLFVGGDFNNSPMRPYRRAP